MNHHKIRNKIRRIRIQRLYLSFKRTSRSCNYIQLLSAPPKAIRLRQKMPMKHSRTRFLESHTILMHQESKWRHLNLRYIHPNYFLLWMGRQRMKLWEGANWNKICSISQTFNCVFPLKKIMVGVVLSHWKPINIFNLLNRNSIWPLN